MEPLLRLIPWILPPLLGAIIGYVTNAIAIRMLFRPLTEKRIFGIRIPLTPGLIPRERGDLAESMARMVSSELLTEEAVRNQIRAPSLHASVERSINSVTSDLLDTPLGRIGGVLLPSFSRPAGAEVEGEPTGGGLLGSFGALLSSVFSGFTRSQSFTSLLKDLVRHLVGELADRPVASVIGKNRTLDGLVEGIVKGLSSERGRSEIRSRVSTWIARQFQDNIPLETLISEEDVASLSRFADSVYPSLIKFLMRWLRSEGTRRELVIRGRFLVQDIVDRLSGIQRFIISAAQYQRTLDENMQGIIEDALRSVEEAGNDPQSRQKVMEVVQRELLSMRGKGLADLAKHQEETIERIAGGLAERAVGMLGGPEFREGLVKVLVGEGAEGEKTVGELLDGLLGLNGRDPGDFLVELIFPERKGKPTVGALSAEGTVQLPAALAEQSGGGIAEMVKGFFRGYFKDHREMRLREFLGMDDATKAEFDRALTGTLISTVDARVPEILRTINIHDLVVSKINGLNIEEVELLLLRVIEKHLRWINVFGAILGALIGFIQDLLKLLQLSA